MKNMGTLKTFAMIEKGEREIVERMPNHFPSGPVLILFCGRRKVMMCGRVGCGGKQGQIKAQID
jgi:hypothetical protein